MSNQTSANPVPSLVEICDAVFACIQSLQAPAKLGDTQAVQAQVRALFGEMQRSAASAGIGKEDIALASFALMAFADETIAESGWPDRTRWPFLQLAYYNIHRAGERFFENLLKLSGDDYSPAIWKKAAQASLLEIYYLCLLLGFRGAWAFSPADQLQSGLEEIQRHIRSRAVSPLSPHIVPKPYSSAAQAVRARWMWAAIALHLAFIIALVVIYMLWNGFA